VATVFLRHPDPLLERINIARVCDTDPVAPILDKLVGPLRKATGWPDAIRIRVIDDPLPNAATVAGGEIILFKGMLFFAHDGDELAGILAHEMGHVTRRHAVRNLFVTSLNFFGFDQLLGNFSGQLVVHPVSGLMLTRREGRRAEKEADLSAIRYLDKAGYKVRPLADILDRVGYLQGEKEVSEGWLATHPLSRNRARMIRDAAPPGPRTNVLTPAEFGQLRAVCETRSPKSNAPLAEADPASANNPSSPLEDNAATVDEPAPVEQKAAPEPHDSRPHPESGQNADKAGEDDGKRIDAPAAPSADAGAAPAEEEKKGEETHDAEAPNLGEWDVGGGSD